MKLLVNFLSSLEALAASFPMYSPIFSISLLLKNKKIKVTEYPFGFLLTL